MPKGWATCKSCGKEVSIFKIRKDACVYCSGEPPKEKTEEKDMGLFNMGKKQEPVRQQPQQAYQEMEDDVPMPTPVIQPKVRMANANPEQERQAKLQKIQQDWNEYAATYGSMFPSDAITTQEFQAQVLSLLFAILNKK